MHVKANKTLRRCVRHPKGIQAVKGWDEKKLLLSSSQNSTLCFTTIMNETKLFNFAFPQNFSSDRQFASPYGVSPRITRRSKEVQI